MFLHSDSPGYFGPSLSLSSCSYNTRHSQPDYQYLTVPPFHSSLHKSVNHFGHNFAFDTPKLLNDLPDNVCSITFIASFRKKLTIYPIAKVLSAIVSLSPLCLLWYDLAMSIDLRLFILFSCSFASESANYGD